MTEAKERSLLRGFIKKTAETEADRQEEIANLLRQKQKTLGSPILSTMIDEELAQIQKRPLGQKILVAGLKILSI